MITTSVTCAIPYRKTKYTISFFLFSLFLMEQTTSGGKKREQNQMHVCMSVQRLFFMNKLDPIRSDVLESIVIENLFQLNDGQKMILCIYNDAH